MKPPNPAAKRRSHSWLTSLLILSALFTAGAQAGENSQKVHCAVSSHFRDGAVGNEVLEFGSYQESDWFGLPRGGMVKLRGTVTYKRGGEADGDYLEKRLLSYGGTQWRKFFEDMCERAYISDEVVFVPEQRRDSYMISRDKGEHFTAYKAPEEGPPFLVDSDFRRLSADYMVTRSIAVESGQVTATQITYLQSEWAEKFKDVTTEVNVYNDLIDLTEQGKEPDHVKINPVFVRKLKSPDWGENWVLDSYEVDRSQIPEGTKILGEGYRYRPENKIVEPIPGAVGVALDPNFINPFENEMVTLPGGSFLMGSEEGDEDERPVHEVTLLPFAISRYEVTQAQWRAVMGNNPSEYRDCGEDCPVEKITWDDTQVFLDRLNRKTGKQYRLPSEAEWEYACRGGQSGTRYCGGNDLDELAWHAGNSGGGTQKFRTYPVGQKKPNGYGLFDMNGNVDEFVEDEYRDYSEKVVSQSSTTDPSLARTKRGCGAYRTGDHCRVTNRTRVSPESAFSDMGFRIAMSMGGNE
jgi:formylglycine-generating enzyme required for sulfatase activity